MQKFQYNNIICSVPAPTCLMTIFSRSSDLMTRIEMIVDSGAEITCIPEALIPSLGKLKKGEVTAESFSGETYDRISYFIEIEFLGKRFKNLEVVPVDVDHGYLGRDVLNHFRLILDAPQASWYHDI